MKQHLGWVLLSAALVLHAGSVTPVAAQETEALGDDYVAGNFGRLLYQENGVTVRRTSTASDPSLERVAGLNAPIFPGEGVITASDQRAEIQLAGGSLVRIDRATDLTFLSMPDPYAEVADNMVLQLEHGAIRINALLSGDSEFRIDTPTATAFLLDDADLRVAVDADGTTYIASHRGIVDVTVGDRSVLLRSGTKTTIYPGGAPEAPVSFNTLRGDGFDRWVAKRDAEWRENERYADNSKAYDEIPDEVRPYYRELSRNGRWVYLDDYGWSWYPSNVGANWSPYNDGYWSYGSRGYFWVSHESWGWAPYHYGRWGYTGGAWHWIPGRVFGGAWVAWSWGSAYVGWSPLGYWNTAYYGTPWGYSYGYYGPSWSFVNYSHFGYRSYRHHVVRYDRIDRTHLTNTAVVTRPPRVSPRELARSGEARERARRLADTDRVAHLRPVDQEQRGTRNNLRGVERRLTAERGARVAAMRERTGSGSERVQPAGSGSRRTGPIAADRDGRRDLNGNSVTRRTTTRPSNGRGITRATQGTRGATPRSDSAKTSRQRMRDVYESMSGPRSTRERRGESASRSSSRGSSGSRPRATPSRRSGGSRPKASPSRSSGRGRPKATPSRSSGRSRPKASPSRSSGRSRPKASPSRRSGGSRPKASSSRGSRSSGSKSSGKKKDRS